MATVRDAAQVIRRVRQQLGLSQSALARLLNATNGSVKHWEHGRTSPNLARLLALQQLCPRGRERAQLDALVRQTQAQVAPLGVGAATGGVREAQKTRGPTGASVAFSSDEAELRGSDDR
jgi:transcriptional regulator with XRE-family HTH domain